MDEEEEEGRKEGRWGGMEREFVAPVTRSESSVPFDDDGAGRDDEKDC